MNELERVILAGSLLHGGHPVWRWCFDNVAIHTDSAGNRTMHKGKSRDRIDGAVATWMRCRVPWRQRRDRSTIPMRSPKTWRVSECFRQSRRSNCTRKRCAISSARR
jgi:hypothetical protein